MNHLNGNGDPGKKGAKQGSYDVVILGGGLAALTLSLQLRQSRPGISILILEMRNKQVNRPLNWVLTICAKYSISRAISKNSNYQNMVFDFFSSLIRKMILPIALSSAHANAFLFQVTRLTAERLKIFLLILHRNEEQSLFLARV